jgi:predicted short-subunit dehydrogenase-like oxidoreductase (DUF2520 family)
MKIVLIGSGNVAWNLGKLFVQYQHEVVQIISRNAATATALAYELNTESANYFSILNKDADLYVIAVKDDAIESIAKEMVGLNKLIVHTSGAIPITSLEKTSTIYGSLYPIQSLIYGVKKIPQIPFLVQGNTENTVQQLNAFVQTLQSNFTTIKNEDKAKLHIAAVLVNNFTHHLYVLAQQWCKKQNLDFALLLPLIQETANRVVEEYKNNANVNLQQLQTGPAVRGDEETIAAHKMLLKEDEKLLELYDLLTKSILIR